MAKEDGQVREAKLAARFKRQLESPPRAVAVATPREGMEY